MSVMNVTLSNFDEVKNSEKTVLLDFYAVWCGPCQMLSPIVDELSEEYKGKIKVGKVNVDEQGELAASFAIVSIPTLLLFQNGKLTERLVGVRSQDELEDMIEKYL